MTDAPAQRRLPARVARSVRPRLARTALLVVGGTSAAALGGR